MKKQSPAISNDMGQLAEDTRALMATADVAGEKVGSARKRLVAGLVAGAIAGGLAGKGVAE